MDQLKITNDRIQALYERSALRDDLVLIEGTVNTGFESVALHELSVKYPELNADLRCAGPGRIFFTVPIQELSRVKYFGVLQMITHPDPGVLLDIHVYPHISKLRSIDHISIVIHSENVDFQDNKEEDLKYFEQLPWTLDVSKGLAAWTQLTEFQAAFNGDYTNDACKFRVTGVRSYKHAFTSMEAAALFGGRINDRFKWGVSMTNFDLEILLYIMSNRVTVALKVTRISNHCRNITYFGLLCLRATVCYNLLSLARPKPGDVVVDPLSGGGSIPIECELAFPDTHILCGDNDERAVERTYKNLEALATTNIHQFAWDATRLPLKECSVDVIVTDLPFGKRSGSVSDNRVLYLKLLDEFGRVCKPNVSRMVLMTNDRRSLLNALNKSKAHYWNKSQLLAVKLGGLTPLVMCLKRNKLPYSS